MEGYSGELCQGSIVWIVTLESFVCQGNIVWIITLESFVVKLTLCGVLLWRASLVPRLSPHTTTMNSNEGESLVPFRT